MANEALLHLAPKRVPGKPYKIIFLASIYEISIVIHEMDKKYYPSNVH